MSTHSITHSMTHGPIPFAAAAAVVAAIAVGSVVVSHDSTGSGGSDTHPTKVVVHKWHPTTAGGRTMTGTV